MTGDGQTCNVPGCDEELGEEGVWCEEHHPDNRAGGNHE